MAKSQTTHFEIEQRCMDRKWWPIVMPGCGGVALRFPTLDAAKARYAGRQFRFVCVVDGRRHAAA